MRHRKHNYQLGVKSAHRLAFMANLAVALIKHGEIKTTLSKAKALRPFIEKIITLAKEANASGTRPERALHLRRLALARVRDKEAVGLLFNERAKEFLDRPGGYTRIYKLGFRRGDATETALIQLIPADDTGYEKSRKPKKGQKSAPTKKSADTETAAGKAKPKASVNKKEAPVSVSESTESEPEAEVKEDTEQS